jgi:hypothetical protein
VQQLSYDELESIIKATILAELQSQAADGWLSFMLKGVDNDNLRVIVDGELDFNGLAAAIAAKLINRI